MRASIASFSAILFVAVVGAVPQSTTLHNTGVVVAGGSNNNSTDTGNFVGSCDVGTQMCCESIQAVDDSIMATLSGALGLNPASKMIGANCNPHHGDATDSNTCNGSPVCCETNIFNGGGAGDGVMGCQDLPSSE